MASRASGLRGFDSFTRFYNKESSRRQTMHIINGKERASNYEKLHAKLIQNMDTPPQLTVMTVGGNAAGDSYVRGKQNMASRIGVKFRHIMEKSGITQDDLINSIKTQCEVCDGFILQLPLPEYLDTNEVLKAIPKEKDVDGLGQETLGELMSRDNTFDNFTEAVAPCTPRAVMDILGLYYEPGKTVLLLGRSNHVGKPLATMLITAGYTVTVLNSASQVDIATEISRHDIIISAIGKPKAISGGFRPGHIVIDVGINIDPETNKLCGDIDFDAASEAGVAAITPVPGGVGPVTVSMLMMNLITLKNRQDSHE